MRQITAWCATHLFGVTAPLVYTGNSGDTVFYWVRRSGCWSSRRSPPSSGRISIVGAEYVTLHKWFRLFIRLALAAQMFDYGMAKIIPTQFPAPSLVTLVEPIGHLSLTDLLWTSIGASPAYRIFTGFAELVGGLLLLVPAPRCLAR